jgi:hypothetical protein
MKPLRIPHRLQRMIELMCLGALTSGYVGRGLGGIIFFSTERRSTLVLTPCKTELSAPPAEKRVPVINTDNYTVRGNSDIRLGFKQYSVRIGCETWSLALTE